MSFSGNCFGSNIAVLPVENKQVTESGLDFTALADKNQKWGKGLVVAAGENVPLDKEGVPYIKEGDIIIFDKNKASDYVEDTVEYKVMYYQDVFKKL